MQNCEFGVEVIFSGECILALFNLVYEHLLEQTKEEVTELNYYCYKNADISIVWDEDTDIIDVFEGVGDYPKTKIVNWEEDDSTVEGV